MRGNITRFLWGCVVMAVLSCGTLTTALIAQSNAPELQRVPPALLNLTPDEINSNFGPVGGHTVSVGAPGRTHRSGLIGWFLEEGPQDIVIPCTSAEAVRVTATGKEGAGPTREQVLYDASLKFDLIALGTVGPMTSFVLPDGGFLYSMMPFHITDIVKNNPRAPVQEGATISVGREGGFLRVGNKSVRAECTAFQLFHPGKQYLLFLRYLPKSQVYLAVRGAFQFINGKAAGTGAHREEWYGSGPPIAGMDESELLEVAKHQAEQAKKAKGDAKP